MEKSERIDFIGEQRRSGKTLQEIGDILGVTRERVRQVCALFGFLPPEREKKPLIVRKKRNTDHNEVREKCKLLGLPDPYLKYLSHKSGSAVRNIGFELTFPQWWEIWEPYYAERGNRKGCKVMCRTFDSGPYAVGNVRIDTIKSNAAECGLVKKCSKPRWGSKSYSKRGVDWMNAHPERPDEALELSRGELDE